METEERARVPDGIKYREAGGAFGAGGPGAHGGAARGVKTKATLRAVYIAIAIPARKDAAARRAANLNLGLAIGIGVTRDDVRREEVDAIIAPGAFDLHDPEVVEHIAWSRIRINRAVQAAHLLSDTVGESLEGAEDASAVKGPKGRSNSFDRNGVDVPTECCHAKFVGFTDCRSRAHERIEDGNARKSMATVEFVA